METLITKNIRISVVSSYREDYSNPSASKFIFVYRIIIENLGTEPVQLLKRRWFIFDSDGTKREVEGEGVIGQQPILQAGESHQYSSWCPLSSGLGYMRGSYVFRNLTSQKPFSARIPQFNLLAPQVLN